MNPVDTSATTRRLGAPAGLTDVEALPVIDFPPDETQPPRIVSVWMLDEMERAAVAAGATVVLSVIGDAQPPVALDVNAPICEQHQTQKTYVDDADNLLGGYYRCPSCL